jgi:hypothetical protein
MPRVSNLRTIIDRAREAYDIAATPAIGPIYEHSMRWGVDPEQYTDPSDAHMIHQRMRLLQYALDVKGITERYLAQLTAYHGDKRAERLKDWLMPGGNTRDVSHWHQQELEHDRKQLLILLLKGSR